MANFLDQLGLTAEELGIIIEKTPSLRGMIVGYAAEMKLESLWLKPPRFTQVIKHDDHDRSQKGDRVCMYKGVELRVECKSLQTNSVRRLKDGSFSGKVQCDASDRRKIKLPNGSHLETTCLRVGEFDILAVNLIAFRGKWDFIFALNQELPRSTYAKYTPLQRRNLLTTLIPVTWPPHPPFTDNLEELADRVARTRGNYR